MPTPLRANDPSSVGPYTLLARLGEGGQGVVYLARSAAGAEVAVKLLRAGIADDGTARARLVKELAAARRVAAAYTAQVLDADVDSDRPYVVSEYVDGPSLQAVVAELGPRTGVALERVAAGTLAALVAVHEAGVVHRDFKPANVLLGRTGPRVIDFGIARALDATATLTASVVGTPAFMAPEQISPPDDRPVGPAADVWAWAATIVYAATGNRPFGSESVPVVMHRVLFAEPDLTGFPDTPLRQVVSACLAKDPGRRPTPRAALNALTSGPAGLTAPPGQPGQPGQPTGLPPSPATGSDRAVPRRTVVAAGATLGVAAAAAAGWFGFDALSDRSDRGKGPQQPTSTSTRKQVPARPSKGLRLPETEATIVSAFSGKITLSAYYVPGSTHQVPYLWMRDGTFQREPGTHPHQFLKVSPDGQWAVANYEAWGDATLNYVTIYDRTRSAIKAYRTIKPPGDGTRLEGTKWSPDGRRLLIQVVRNGVRSILPLGFLLVEPANGWQSRFIHVPDRRPWTWLPDGSGIAANPSTASTDIVPDVEIFDLEGKLRYHLTKGGLLPGLGYGAFDPAGALLVASVAKDRLAVYGYHPTDQSSRLRTLYERPLPPPPDDPFYRPSVGWYDTDHLVAQRERNGRNEVFTFTAQSRYDDRWLEEEVASTLIEDPKANVGFELSVSTY